MNSIFSQIIAGEIPCYKITENTDCIAFLDINPNAEGHTLCVTKQEVDRLLQLPQDQYLKLMAFSYKVGLAIEAVIPCNRVGMSIIGLEVPHVHVHLIPLNSMADATFEKKVYLTKDQMQFTANQIAQEFYKQNKYQKRTDNAQRLNS